MTDYLKNPDSEWYRQRVAKAMLPVIAAFVVLAARLFYLQVIEGEEFRRLSENNCIRLESIDPPRGLIFDRHGSLMVDNRPSFDLSIIPKDAAPLDRTVQKLAGYLDVPAEEIMTEITRKKGLYSYKPVMIRQDIGRNALAAIEAHKFELPGVILDVKPRRNYIFARGASHLIGYLSEINAQELACGKYPECRVGDYIGKFGIEKEYEAFLKGKRGGRQVEVNVNGQVVRVLKTVEAQPGYNLFLTIEEALQKKAETLIEGVAGAVVAMDPQSGQILAMASSPSFDQNAFISGISYDKWELLLSNPFRPMENKVIHAEYPPASTYKIVTAIAALEEGVIDENTTYFCPGFYKCGNRIFRCWKRGGHGACDLTKALAESCDVYFYQVGQKLGVDRLAWYAKACGLGEPTGIDVDHEAGGFIPTAAWKRRRFGVPWQGGETLSVAIGQGYNLVTPLQLVVMTSAVANGGIRYKPGIVHKIETAEGEVVKKFAPQVAGRLPVKEETLAMVKKGLWEVVNTPKGTAKIARLEAVDILGKTGTAQVIGRKINELAKEEVPDYLKDHAWFVAYAPADAPRIAVAVIIEHGEHGSGAAAPVARELIKTYLEFGREPEAPHAEKGA